MGSREDAHRLVDAIPEHLLPIVEQVLRASLDTELAARPREFTSTGTLSADHDLAERSDGTLREDHGRPE